MIEYIDYEKCIDCGHCTKVCPMDVIRTIGNRSYLAFQKDCMTCFVCEIECPREAIYVSPFRAWEPVKVY